MLVTLPYATKALDTLKEKGFRITRPRRLVVDLLAESEMALSAYEIKDRLEAEQEAIDTVSIYRILDCLESNHLIHRLLGSGKVMKCRLESEDHCHKEQHDHCHHLLLCTRCGKVDEIHCPGMTAVVASVQQESGYRVQRHHLEFSGVCPSCGNSPL